MNAWKLTSILRTRINCYEAISRWVARLAGADTAHTSIYIAVVVITLCRETGEKEMNEDIISAVIFLAFTAVVVVAVVLLDAKGCENRWEGTYQTDWSMLGGCRVKVGGKFLPEANVREIER